ncbi:ribonuclease P protein component [Patescibacteria group bacterium]|nr:ribonuclease P protein component [Patescibacteria group bacterium]
MNKRKPVTRKIFDRILKTGKTYHQPLFSFHTLHTLENVYRIACVVPKSTEKSAVLRNKLRRRCYYALYKLLNNNKHFLGILFIKSGAKRLPYKLFEEKISIILKKSGIL